MIVEAMKTMNHVPSTSDGEVKKFLFQMVSRRVWSNISHFKLIKNV